MGTHLTWLYTPVVAGGYDRWKSWATLLGLTTVEGFWLGGSSAQMIVLGTLAIGILILIAAEWDARRARRR